MVGSLDDSAAPGRGSGGAPAAPERPRPFGDYTLLTTLAVGGMGTIHLAKRVGFRPDIQRFCVVKKLLSRRPTSRSSPALAVDRDVLQRFHDEARVVVTLNHRALCHVFDVGIVDGEHYLAMELIEGVTLRALWTALVAQGRRLDPHLALYILDEVLDALSYAHDHKDPGTGTPLRIVHRDVSPQNVMLSFSGGVKVIDFGLVASALKSEHTQGGFVVGKLSYMAPEQARGEAIDVRADVYACAVLLCELLTGRRFYGQKGKDEIGMELCEGTFIPDLDDVPEPLHAPLLRALAPEAIARTDSALRLQSELAAAFPARASSRELRELIAALLPAERTSLEELVRSYSDVDAVPLARAPHRDGEATAVTTIARAPERPDPPEPLHDVTAVNRDAPFVAPPLEATATQPLSNPRTRPRTPTTPAPATRPKPASPSRWALASGALLGGLVVTLGAWALFAPNDPPPPAPAVALPGAPPPAPTPQPLPQPAVDALPEGLPDTAPDAPAAGPDGVVAGDDAVDDATAPPRQKRPRVTKPPSTALPDLAAHLDYLGRHCLSRPKSSSCARRVTGERGRIPLLDVQGLRALRKDAEACVVECRR